MKKLLLSLLFLLFTTACYADYSADAFYIGRDTGVKATAVNGTLTLQGLKSGGNNENLQFDFETTSNITTISSTTGTTQLLLSSLGLIVSDDTKLSIGSSGLDSFFSWSTTGNDNLQLGLNVASSSYSGYFNIIERSDVGNANRSPLATSTDPVLRIYSSTATDAVGTDNANKFYGEFYHDGVAADTGEFHINSGFGNIALTPPSGNVVEAITADAGTNSISEMLRLSHSTSGTAAAGFGSGINFDLEDASGNAPQNAGRIATVWTTATHSGEASAITLSGVSAGGALTEWARLTGSSFGILGAFNFAADSVGTDAYNITLVPTPTALTTGMMVTFTAGANNTGACTLDIDGAGALAPVALKALHDQDPPDNYIESGSVVVGVYDGTNFQLISNDANP